MTPAVEDIENLDKSDGGDNLNLIFKIMKRGDKLKKAMDSGDEANLCDMGLRYDLTLPLSRYYANNREKLAMPAKCIQIDKVYRAERPQKGRLREFVQCDIDIIGSKSINSEIELIHTTAKALMAIDITDFKIKINDRRILKALLQSVGFLEEELDSVCITFDKLDKIGADGVCEELVSKQFSSEAIGKFSEVIKNPLTLYSIQAICGEESVADVSKIISEIKAISGGKYEIEFDISLVRGQGYYTGTVFEIVSDKFKGSIAGGGRYDNLIGKFIGEQIPAVGFSIGFERIFSMLSESEYKIPDVRRKLALFYDGSVSEAINESEKLQAEYDVTIYEKPKKLSKFLDRLDGYYGFCFAGETEDIRELK